jgi:hypothetical protein
MALAMDEDFQDKIKDQLGSNEVPGQDKLARMSDRLDEVRERREQKKAEGDDDEESEDRQGEDDEAS